MRSRSRLRARACSFLAVVMTTRAQRRADLRLELARIAVSADASGDAPRTITALAAHALRTGLRIPPSYGTSVTPLTDA